MGQRLFNWQWREREGLALDSLLAMNRGVLGRTVYRWIYLSGLCLDTGELAGYNGITWPQRSHFTSTAAIKGAGLHMSSTSRFHWFEA